MFLVKYFKMGFQFPKLISNSRQVSFVKIILYFVLLSFIANFPLTWLTFEEQGSRINFIEQNIVESVPDWTTLPSATITSGGINASVLDGSSYVNGRFIYYFGFDESIDTLTDYNVIVFYSDYIQYIDINGATIRTQGYSGFESHILLSELNFSTGLERIEVYKAFAKAIEQSFSTQIILYTVIRNQIVQFTATLIFILILSGIIQLYRFGLQNFLTYIQGLNFIILCSTLPSVLALIFGLILPGFAPVVFNLALGLVVMLVLLIFTRKNYS